MSCFLALDENLRETSPDCQVLLDNADTEYKTIRVADHVRIHYCQVPTIHKLNLANPKHLDVREPAHEVKHQDNECASPQIIEIFYSSRPRTSLAKCSKDIVSNQEAEESESVKKGSAVEEEVAEPSGIFTGNKSTEQGRI